ncbi:MAG: aldehyde dehydrogenase family protein [Candidatus Nealsonbacteria bacterium]|nr:aldehyde dehydrogenase family protein [Candidatus Nealsonbacteria bacterium]
MVSFAPETKERMLLKEALWKLECARSKNTVLPLLIGGEEIVTDDLGDCVVPHNHQRILAKYSKANSDHVFDAIKSVLCARKKWRELDWFMRLNIFRKAAYLLQTKYFYELTAVTMENYSKNPYEAMIDVCELVDFWNFNAYYAYLIYKEQPDTLPYNFNFTDWRPLEGFVAALPPNNFISIAGNLPTAPLTMGNVVVCKPARDTVAAFYPILNILYEAGLPKETLSVVNGDSEMIGKILLDSPDLAGIHFTGSTDVFNWIVKKVGENTGNNTYKSYPHRSAVGETGGKDFLVVCDDEDPKVAAASIVVGGFGYQGRKCSATSRVYISEEMWRRVRPKLMEFIELIKVGDVKDFKNFMGAIISEAEYSKILEYINTAKTDRFVNERVIEVLGGECANSVGWFIGPAVIVTKNPCYRTMKKEIFGPVVTVCLLDKNGFEETLKLCDRASEYGLTGAINTKDVFSLCEGLDALRYAAGNVYDWKTTGAVVGQQPFGGARKSGTDDKAGSKINLYRWVIPRTISLSHQKPGDFAPAYLEK